MIDKNSHQKHSSLIHELKQNNFQSLPSQKRPSRQDKILQQDTVKEKEIVAIPQNIKQNQSQINKSDDPQPQPMPSLYIQSQLNQEIALSGGFKQLQSGVMDTNVEQPTLSSKREDKQIINKQTNSNIAVSFQSFGLHQIKHINPPSLQVQQAQPQTQMVLHTSQSLQMQQNSKEESSFQSNSFQRRSPQQSSCIKMVQSGEECFLKQTQKIKKQHVDFKRYSQKSNSNSSSSNEDILNMDVDKKQQKNPFYANYTSVQSKFDIMVKKDSNAEQLIREQHQRKISGLANLQDQEQDEQNKQIYKDIIVNKVDSQYQQFMDKNSAFSQSMKIGGKCHSNVLFSPRSIEEEDFLDVQFMEKSLDFKYNSGFKKKKQEKEEADDQLNVANLDSKLSKYEASQKSIKKEQLPQSQLNIHQSIDNTNKVIHSQSAMSQRVGIKKLPSIQYKTAKDGFRPEESSDKNINGFSSSYYQQMNFYDFTMETHKSPQTNQSSLGKTGNTSNYYKSIRHYSSLQKDPYYSTNNRQNNQIQKSNKVKRPPYDQSRNRLQDRYKKYVKQVRSPSKVFTSPTPKEPKKADRQSKERLITSQYQIEQQMPTFRKKQKSPEAKANKNRISYDQLRSILLN